MFRLNDLGLMLDPVGCLLELSDLSDDVGDLQNTMPSLCTYISQCHHYSVFVFERGRKRCTV